jgi:AraC family transcriptional regulator
MIVNVNDTMIDNVTSSVFWPSTLTRDDCFKNSVPSLKSTDSAVVDTRAPHLSLANLTIHRSDCSGCNELHVRVCELPACTHFFTWENSLDAYHFKYRPKAGLIIPSLGGAGRENCDSLLLIPPRVRVQTEWTSAAGRIAIFSLAPRFLQTLSDQISMPLPFLKQHSLVSFTMDQRFELLCRLLMQETEDHCLQGPVYFQGLARALVVSLLRRVREPQGKASARVSGIPPGIQAAIRTLEDEYWESLSVAELAHRANLSVDHFARLFERVTGLTPHRYLLQVRLSRARAMMTRRAPAMSLGKIAVTCGFADQTHFGRHFRRSFGMTPTAFLRMQLGSRAQQRPSNNTYRCLL